MPQEPAIDVHLRCPEHNERDAGKLVPHVFAGFLAFFSDDIRAVYPREPDPFFLLDFEAAVHIHDQRVAVYDLQDDGLEDVSRSRGPGEPFGFRPFFVVSEGIALDRL